MAPLTLGSASPRRAQLLAQLGVRFVQRAADIDETPRADEAPTAYVRRMAREKARALGAEAGPLLTADTTVIIEGQSLGKPRDRDEARAMLTQAAQQLAQQYDWRVVVLRLDPIYDQIVDRP